MLTDDSINKFIDHLRICGMSENTCRAYKSDLQAAQWFIHDPFPATTWEAVETRLSTYLNVNRGVWAPKTTCRKLGTFRTWGAFEGHTILAKYKPPKPAKPEPHPIPEGIDGVLAMIKRTRNPRHKALCALTGLMGLRVEEAINVCPSHFDMSNMTLKVRGKGDKTRIVPVTPAAWSYLSKATTVAMKAGVDSPLVPLTNRGARAAITRHARNAGLSRHVSSHDMRATFLTRAYEKSHDIRAVQELAGHADVRQTQVYTGVTMAGMRAAAEVV